MWEGWRAVPGCGWNGWNATVFLALCISGTPMEVSKNNAGSIFGAEMVGAPRQKRTFLALGLSTTPVLGVQKHYWRHIWSRGMPAWGATPEHTFFGIVHPRHLAPTTDQA